MRILTKLSGRIFTMVVKEDMHHDRLRVNSPQKSGKIFPKSCQGRYYLCCRGIDSSRKSGKIFNMTVGRTVTTLNREDNPHGCPREYTTAVRKKTFHGFRQNIRLECQGAYSPRLPGREISTTSQNVSYGIKS
jgi:hypothetical protein